MLHQVQKWSHLPAEYLLNPVFQFPDFTTDYFIDIVDKDADPCNISGGVCDILFTVNLNITDDLINGVNPYPNSITLVISRPSKTDW